MLTYPGSNPARGNSPKKAYCRKELLTSYGYQEIGMDHFALEDDSLFQATKDGTLHRNFMGYTQTPSASVIGLGTSAISDAWKAFAQNVKVVEKYNEMTKKGELPILKGHLLTKEDEVIRRHILNLMCHFTTTWTAAEEKEAPLRESLERLREMEKDGLLTTRPDGVDIHYRGRPFIRNACMAFDVRMWRQKPEGRIFSMTI